MQVGYIEILVAYIEMGVGCFMMQVLRIEMQVAYM